MNDANPQVKIARDNPNKPKFSPGCFGSVLGYKEDDVCGACDFREQCRAVHLRAKEQFAAYFAGVEHTIGGRHDAHVRRINREKAKGNTDAKAYCIANPPAPRADLSGLTDDEKAERKREQARQRKAKQRAKNKSI